MGTRRKNAAKRPTTVEKMRLQLKDWVTQLDGLVTGYLEAGAQLPEAYKDRLDALRAQHGVAQARLDEYTDASDHTQTWAAFRAGIKDDWRALEAGFRDLAP